MNTNSDSESGFHKWLSLANYDNNTISPFPTGNTLKIHLGFTAKIFFKKHKLCHFLPTRRIALAGNSHRIVSVCLAVCPSQPVLYQNGNS